MTRIMADFQFLQNPASKKWVILSPNRAKRPDMAKGPEPVCPFCLGREKDEPSVYQVPGGPSADWAIRVVHNKFPFAPIHEVIIHSPDHHKNFDELPDDQNSLIFQTYRQRFLTHKDDGQVVIFNNHGEAGGESLPHPHTQLAVVPSNVHVDIPMLGEMDGAIGKATYFQLFCPTTSQWPDEVWIVPEKRGRIFYETTDEELMELASLVKRLILSFTEIYGHEFPYNFYIYPGGDWYFRLVPRGKTIGGFELSTGIFVNTKDPAETVKFLKEKLKI